MVRSPCRARVHHGHDSSSRSRATDAFWAAKSEGYYSEPLLLGAPAPPSLVPFSDSPLSNSPPFLRFASAPLPIALLLLLLLLRLFFLLLLVMLVMLQPVLLGGSRHVRKSMRRFETAMRSS